jgi:Predicted periplasmic solute-binding protein
MNRGMRLLVLGIILITVALGAARVWVDRIVSLQSAVVEIEVTPGESASSVLARLAPALSLTERRLVFQIYPEIAAVQVGLYRFTESLSVIDAMRAISEGDAVTYRLTVPEGITASQLLK